MISIVFYLPTFFPQIAICSRQLRDHKNSVQSGRKPRLSEKTLYLAFFFMCGESDESSDEYVNYYNNGDYDVSRFEPVFLFGKKYTIPFGQGGFQCFTGR